MLCKSFKIFETDLGPLFRFPLLHFRCKGAHLSGGKDSSSTFFETAKPVIQPFPHLLHPFIPNNPLPRHNLPTFVNLLISDGGLKSLLDPVSDATQQVHPQAQVDLMQGVIWSLWTARAVRQCFQRLANISKRLKRLYIFLLWFVKLSWHNNVELAL